MNPNATPESTCVSHDLRRRSIIDHFVFNEKLFDTIVGMHVYCRADNPSEHCPVRVDLNLETARLSVKTSNSRNKHKVAWHESRTIRHRTIRHRTVRHSLIHGRNPEDMILSSIIPIPKDNAGNKCSSANYRGISLSTCLSKILDIVTLERYKCTLCTSDLQFAFKVGHVRDSSLESRTVRHQTIRHPDN